MKMRVVTESGSCLTQKQAKEYDIDVLPMQIFVNDKSYDDGYDLDAHGLEDIMETGAYAMTSQPKPSRARELFQRYKDEGVTDVIAIHMSPGLSGTLSLVLTTGKEFGINVHYTDTFTTLAVEGYWAKAARELVSQNIDPDEIIRRIAVSVDHSRGFLEPYDLNHLAKGGRLTPFAAKFAGMLQIKPICEVSKYSKGKVGMHSKVRTMSRAIRKAVQICTEEIEDPDNYVFYLENGRNPEGAQVAIDELHHYYPNAHFNVDVLSPVILAHAGIKSIGIQYAQRVEGTTVE